jgi:hypothetical protein
MSFTTVSNLDPTEYVKPASGDTAVSSDEEASRTTLARVASMQLSSVSPQLSTAGVVETPVNMSASS